VNAPGYTLLFVYNADSGLFNTLADIGHKLLSPDTYACDLCALTHGYFSEKGQWREFVESLDLECEFLHRDQFRQRYPSDTTPLPAIFRKTRNAIHPCIDSQQLRDCSSLEQLHELIREQCITGR